MSNICSKEIEEVVTRRRLKVTGIKCDSCGKEIPALPLNRGGNKYYYVTTGHHDWGNDSCESVVYHDICPDCINKFTADYLRSGSTTAYIEIETKYAHETYEWIN